MKSKRQRGEEYKEDNANDNNIRSSRSNAKKAKSASMRANKNGGDLLKILDGDDDGDWKRPLFYWKGHLTIKSGKIDWKGSWVADLASNGLPSLSDFTETKESNSFHLTSTKLKIDKKGNDSKETSTSSQKEIFSALSGRSGNFKGTYLLDQGDGMGPQQQRDYKHSFTFDSDPREIQNGESMNNILFLTASGSTQFGSFISAGYVVEGNESSSNSVELVLARRYIEEDDDRQSLVSSKSHGELLCPELSLKKENKGSKLSELWWIMLIPRKLDP